MVIEKNPWDMMSQGAVSYLGKAIEVTMSLSIRQRGQKVAECIQTKRRQGLQAMAKATGLTISSVYRHQQALARRNQRPESWWWAEGALNV